MSRHNKVVVTGLGVLAANGIGVGEFWRSLLAGESGIRQIGLFDASELPCRIAGEISDFNPFKFIDRQLKPQRMARSTQLAVAATGMAVADAGLSADELKAMDRLPIVLGVSSSAVDVLEDHARQVQRRGAAYGVPYSTYAFMPHAAASTISYCLGLKAHPVTISTACAAGLDAIGSAYAMVRTGRSDLVIAGGADSPITYLCFASFAAAGLVSGRHNDTPEKASRPFDLDRDCGVIAEGAGVVVLENLEHALGRGAKPYAEILGYAINADEDPNLPGCGLAGTMEHALANAGRRAEDIELINAHGPGHPVLDRVETQMIKKVFGDRAFRIPVSSIKGATGNPLAAAGPHQLVSCCLSLRDEVIPPVANYEKKDPDCDLDYVVGAPRRLRVGNVLINSHGLGGCNCSMVMQRVNGP
jgi:3-oxoacyl-[acyl-carrier-protein] synthase II